MSTRDFEPLGGKIVHEGHVITVHVERFRFADDEEVERDVVRHPGAAAVVAHDGEQLWLVRQPRQAVNDPDSLEIPAGLLDQADETPLETAKRELAEEIGKQAQSWTPLTEYRSSVGFTDEVVHVFLAEELSDVPGEADAGDDERIEIVHWPLTGLDDLIDQVTDAKTLIGLLLLRERIS